MAKKFDVSTLASISIPMQKIDGTVYVVQCFVQNWIATFDVYDLVGQVVCTFDLPAPQEQNDDLIKQFNRDFKRALTQTIRETLESGSYVPPVLNPEFLKEPPGEITEV